MAKNCFKGYIILSGFVLCFGYDDLSDHKLATQSKTPPRPNDQYKAGNAVDRDISTCMRAEQIGTTSPDKTMWWKVDLGGVYNIYSVNILFKNYDGQEVRQQGRFAGFSLFISNNGMMDNSSLCYKDGPKLPPLNFTRVCITSGRYVIFYNERLDGVSYPSGYEFIDNVFTEICEVLVYGCLAPGVYGTDCNQHCPINCRYNTCHIQNGNCFDCDPGWMGTTCNRECVDGWHGINCTQRCSGHCKDNAPCNHVTGQCDEGCAAGWKGSSCNATCEDGTYGRNCVNNCSGNCLIDSPCNKQTGLCEGGCKPGYVNRLCNGSCAHGFYGAGCRYLCSEHCLNKSNCDHIHGACIGGCQDGYIGTLCDASCQEGHYGSNCSGVCSPNCKTCRHTDGECSCKAGWMGPNCSTACVQYYGENCRYPCSQHCFQTTCDRLNGSCQYGCVIGFRGEKCDQANDTSSNLKSGSDNLVPGTVGGLFGAFAVILIVVVVFVLRFRRKSSQICKRKSTINEPQTQLKMTSLKEPRQTKDNLPTGGAHTISKSIPEMNEPTKRGPPTNKNIPVRNIKAQIANMSVNENDGFKSEYNEIPRGEQHPCLEAKKPENKVKNRYTTIHPYDHSRVLLKLTDKEDYINANFIEDTRGIRSYIATQGPKPKTIEDFWTMIEQEDVSIIVCLTNLKEGTKNKCAQYWPDVNDKLQGKNITVRHLHEKTYAEHIIRRFKIHNKLKQQDRQVIMYHYTAWADHGVADPLSLVVFHRQVMKATAQSTGKYTVVHCSAGVGRTGTYIALDALYREGEKTGKINVPMYVRTMRKDRMNMIQGEDQYKLLYLALMEAFNGPSRCLTTEGFLSEYQKQDCYANCGEMNQKMGLSAEFEELLSVRKVYSQKDYVSGRTHITANYTQTVLPVDEYMCHLSYTRGRNTYYNAVLLQSFLEKDCWISAQFPLPDYTEDFLRLVRDFNAGVVVFLCPIEDVPSSSFWFPTKTQSKFVGNITIKHVSVAKGSNVTMTKLVIQAKETDDLRITVLECPMWREQSTADKRVLLDVIKEVKTLKNSLEGRIVVLSSDGATRCGPFCVVYNALEQLTVDREVDIFTTARQLQVRRPEFVSTLDEYQLCHDTVSEYLVNDCVYGNA